MDISISMGIYLNWQRTVSLSKMVPADEFCVSPSLRFDWWCDDKSCHLLVNEIEDYYEYLNAFFNLEKDYWVHIFLGNGL